MDIESEHSELNEFYNFTVDLTRTASWQTRLIRDHKIILDLILCEHKNNIYLAAKQGRNYAKLLIYEKSAQFRGIISVHDFIEMSPDLHEKFSILKLESVVETLEKYFKPFKICVQNLTECDANDEIKKLISNCNIIVISVLWQI